MDYLGLVIRAFSSLSGYISIGILLMSYFVLNYMYESLVLSLLAFVLPFLVLTWGCVLLALSLFQFKSSSKELRASKLLLLIVYTMLSFSLWPPFWLFRSSPSMEQIRSQSKHQSPISVMTWNLQRLGDLERTAPLRQKSRTKRLACIRESLESIEQDLEQKISIYAFQEVSNKNLKALEEELDINCQHIVYRSIKYAKSGLGLCVYKESDWHLNYVRKIKLKGKGSWRALFGEIGHKKHTNTTFNLLNVHFRPHNINEDVLKNAIFSLNHILEIAREVIANSVTQRQQAKSLLSVIKTYRDPTLLMGDFNAPPRAGTHPLLEESWEDVWREVGQSFGATKYFGKLLPYRIDFIYALKNTFALFSAQVAAVDCSDHRPLITRLALSKE